MKKEPVYGNHIGIVVNQEDPEYRGRVQIYIPYLTNTLYAGWNETLTDKKFKNIGGGGDLTPEVVDKLKNVLPWAECAAPIFGGGTSATYNSTTGRTSTNPYKTVGPVKPASALTDPTQQGLLDKAKSILGNGRTLNFSDDAWGGRCATAVTAIAGAGLGYDALGQEGIGKYGPPNASGMANGSNTALQTSGFYNGPERAIAGIYKPQLGDAIAMEGGKPDSNGVRNGHTIICVDDGRISGSVKFVSDNTGRENYEDYLPGGRKYGNYYNTTFLRPNAEGAARWNKTMGLPSPGDVALDAPTAPNAATAAGVAGAVVNPDDKATGSDSTVKNISSEEMSAKINQRFAGGYLDGYGDTFVGAGAKYGVDPYLLASVAALETGNGKFKGGEGFLASNNVGGQMQKNDPSKPISFNSFEESIYNKARNLSQNYDLTNTSTIGAKYAPAGASNDPNGTNANWPNEVNGIYKTFAGTDYGGSNANTINGSNSLTSPYPNHNAGNVAAHYEGAQSSGMISIPKPGAKVFVFFLAGDIQKPVYFANALEPDTIRKSLQSASPHGKEYDDADNKLHTDVLGNGPVKLSLTNNQGFTSGGIPKDESNIEIGVNGSGWKVSAGASNFHSGGDFSSLTMGGSYETVNGPKTSHTGPSFREVDGDHTTKVGVFDEKQIKAAENLHKLLKEVQTEKVKEIESKAPSGEKVPCPICSTSYPVDKSSAFAKRIFSFLRKLGTLPWFTYSIDLLEFIASLVMLPFFTIMKAADINGGSCGNPDCKGGQVPSPQKPIETANKSAASKLKSKQNEISKLEQQLGNGGTHSVVAAKDIVLSAGMILDDQPVYSTTGNMSHGCSVGPAKNARGTVIVKATGVKQVMHTEASQMPGGNIMLRGGSKVKIIAGSPGIDINSKGKITIGGGSVEIISGESDLILSSPTHTTLKGNGVTIDADDRSGKGGGLVINANQTKVRGLGVTGNMIVGGGMNLKGELSYTYTNTVGERVQTGSGSPPDQRVPFSTWGVGPLQINDTLNSIRTSLTHFAMPGALLNITNIVKLVQQIYNKIYTATVIEPITTGIAIGFIYSQVWNWHHNHMNEPEDHHHDYTRPRGTYYDHESGVHQSAVDESHIPTKPRKKGTGLDGGPKTLAGCGGFGFGGGGSSSRRSINLNSFGIADQVDGFSNTRLSDNNIKFEYNKDGTINVITPSKKVDC